MRLLISFAALFLSVMLLQISSGGVVALDALSGLALGFSREQVGLLGSAHFFGFFLGCWWAPRLMGTVGHSRTFAAFTALGGIGLLAHMMVVHPVAWAGLRIMSGACIAGCYTVIEAWMQAKVHNENRARTLAGYRVVDLGSSLVAQLLIGVLEPASYVSYNLLALLCCASLLPLTLTTLQQPEIPKALRLHPLLAWQKSPLAALSVVVAGMTAAAFRMVGPVYGSEVGLSVEKIAFFLAAFVAGGALAQYPAGWLADKFDRRKVLIGFSMLAMAGCGVFIATGRFGPEVAIASAGLFGFLTFPIYSVAAAHAHDFATSKERVELSSSLLFLYALGAIASPIVASNLISAYGLQAMFLMVAFGHLVLVVFGLSRMRVRPTQAERTSYVYLPRTSFLVGRLLKKSRETPRKK